MCRTQGIINDSQFKQLCDIFLYCKNFGLFTVTILVIYIISVAELL